MPSFGNFLIFPPCVSSVSAGREHSTTHVANDVTDIFLSKWERGRWRFTVGGAKIEASFMDDWDAFVDLLGGQHLPFLFWLKSKRFMLQRQQIATGNGTAKRFQLQKTRTYRFGPTAPTTEVIRFPWDNYPALTNAKGVEVLPTERVKVWVNGVAQTWGTQFTVEREGGVIVFPTAPANGAIIEAQCRFMILVHGQDWTPMQAEGSAFAYQFPSGAEFFESLGEADDVDALLAQLRATGVQWAGEST